MSCQRFPKQGVGFFSLSFCYFHYLTKETPPHCSPTSLCQQTCEFGDAVFWCWFHIKVYVLKEDKCREDRCPSDDD